MHVEDESILCDDGVGLRLIPGLGDDHVRVQIVSEVRNVRIAGPQLGGETQAQPRSREKQQTDPA